MPWYNGNYPPSYKNQPILLREKAVEIANQLLEQGTEEGIAIATGLKRARIFFKKQQPSMSTDKKYIEAFHDYEDFMLKKRQYAKAMHVFHDQTAEYNEMIDDLPVKEMESRQKEFLQHERDFHDVMDSFDRALHAYKKIAGKFKSLKAPVQFSIGKKSYQIQIVNGEIEVKEL
jgi:uncharacterized protein YdaT